MIRKTLDLFLSPINHKRQIIIIIFSSLLFIFMPQLPPSDWELNTVGLFENILNVYRNPSYVYPPWALIPLCLYRLIGPEGTRILSVIVIGVLCKQQQWSLIKFFTITLSPYFLATMTKSNIDIISYVLPIVLINESRKFRRFQFIVQLIAFYLLLIKPQGAILLIPFLLMNNRILVKKSSLLGLIILTVPISLLSNPPLILQWMNNIINPSPENKFYWSINNISVISKEYTLEVILVIFFVILSLLGLVRKRVILWSRNHWISSLLFLSMIFSPYTSQQSFSSALAFIPSGLSFLYQIVIIVFLSYTDIYFKFLPIIIMSVFMVSLLTSKITTSSHEPEK